MLKKCEDGLVVHHEAACLGTSPLVDRGATNGSAVTTVRVPPLASTLRAVGFKADQAAVVTPTPSGGADRGRPRRLVLGQVVADGVPVVPPSAGRACLALSR